MRRDDSGTATELPCSDQKDLRLVLGLFATGVTVVTTGGEVPHAMTANAFTSVSMGPPLVLVCVGRRTVAHRCIMAAQSFAVNVLSAGQQDLARHFADPCRPLGAAQFAGIGWSPGARTGAPLFDGRLASLECTLWEANPGGDHTVFFGHVVSAAGGTGTDPLLFFGSRYRRLPGNGSHARENSSGA